MDEFFSNLLEWAQASPLAYIWVMAFFIVGGLFFVPVTALSMATVLVFAGVEGFVLAVTGAMLSALLSFIIGRHLGRGRLEKYLDKGRVAVIGARIKNGGVVSVILVRMIPAVPYTATNLLMGACKMPLATFLAGSLLSMLPGKVMMALFGTSLVKMLQNPAPGQMIQAGFLLLAWGIVVFMTHRAARYWQAKHPAT